jgi:hypothetical protein
VRWQVLVEEPKARESIYILDGHQEEWKFKVIILVSGGMEIDFWTEMLVQSYIKYDKR